MIVFYILAIIFFILSKFCENNFQEIARRIIDIYKIDAKARGSLFNLKHLKRIRKKTENDELKKDIGKYLLYYRLSILGYLLMSICIICAWWK